MHIVSKSRNDFIIRITGITIVQIHNFAFRLA